MVWHKTIGNQVDFTFMVFRMLGREVGVGFAVLSYFKGRTLKVLGYWRKVKFEVSKKGNIVVVVEKDLILGDAAVVDVIIAVVDICFDSIFRRHS